MIYKYLFDFPEIETIEELSKATNLSESLIYNLSNNSDDFYKHIEKEKSNGEYRHLYCPSKKMKALQAWILRNILENIPIENVAKAFRKNINIKDNAEMHKDNNFMICLDIENFFDNIKGDWVYNLFNNLGYNKHISLLFTNICTYNGALPQGGVTSPYLSNVLLKRLDRRIIGYAGARNIIYTRYADDITLSKNDPAILMNSIDLIKKIIEDEGFKLNDSKTRVLRPGNRREITGLVITDDNKISIGRKRKIKLRAEIHHYICNNKSFWKDHEELEDYIIGWLNFIKGVDKKAYKQIIQYYNKLTDKISTNKELSF